MADLRIDNLENDLRVRMNRFMCDRSKWCRSRFDSFKKIHSVDRDAFLCGGAVRDILLSTMYNDLIPRDLDIIIRSSDMKKVSEVFSENAQKWNCYGGLSVQAKDWQIDIWPLSETWAYKEKILDGFGFSDFPETTFLDIDAVAVQLFCGKGRLRKIYSKGFFEAITKKTIEINLEENPNPLMCIVRSFKIANQFNFALGPNLAKYILSHMVKYELEHFISIYQIRYNSTRLTTDILYRCIKSIKNQLRVSSNQSVRVPFPEMAKCSQPMLWEESII